MRRLSLFSCISFSILIASPSLAKKADSEVIEEKSTEQAKQAEPVEPEGNPPKEAKAKPPKEDKKPEPMGPGIKPTTPEIPGTPWRVHDGTRPQPVAVKPAGALTTPLPEDAKVLFDGSSTDAWLSAKTGEPCPWLNKDGVLVAKAHSILSKQEFGDVQVHLEWRIPSGRKVNGQGGGNSGIFLMRLYEVQILQSHGNQTYPDGTAGAVYGQTPPLVNATLPQGEWQSYDIVFHAPHFNDDGSLKAPATVTALHNGIVVQSETEIMGPTVYRKLASYPKNLPEKAPLLLQWHGDPVEFRNIWVRDLK